MTELLDAAAESDLDTERVGRPRRDAREPRLVDEALADRLIAQAAEQGVELLKQGYTPWSGGDRDDGEDLAHMRWRPCRTCALQLGRWADRP